MGARTIYHCDWCEVQSPLPGSVGEGWDITTDNAGYKLHLCGTCASERRKHIDAARMLRRSSLVSRVDREEKP